MQPAKAPSLRFSTSKSGFPELFTVFMRMARQSCPTMDTKPPVNQEMPRIYAYLLAVGAALLPAVVLLPWRAEVNHVNVVMPMLLMVVLVAARLGRGPALLCGALSVLAFDVGYVPPHGLLTVHDTRYVGVFAVMFAVAWLVSEVASASRQARLQAESNEHAQRLLFELAARLNASLRAADAADGVRNFVAEHLSGKSILHPSASLDRADRAVQSVAEGDTPAVLRIDDRECPVRILLPLRGATRNRGVLEVLLPDHPKRHVQGRLPTLRAVADVLAASLERLHYLDVAIRTQAEVDAERLRHAMLAGLSHDLRTPLTVLYGWADALRESTVGTPDAADAAERVCHEALRLNRLCDSLLDFARLRSAPNLLAREWVPLEELMGTVLAGLQGVPGVSLVQLDLPEDLPWLHVDAILFERLLTNLIDNALKQGGAQQEVRVSAALRGTSIEVVVANSGSRFPDETDWLLQPFAAGSPAGHGFGLSLCRAIIEAHGGIMTAGNVGNFATVTLTIAAATSVMSQLPPLTSGPDVHS